MGIQRSTLNGSRKHLPSISIMKAKIGTTLLLLLLATYASAQKEDTKEKGETPADTQLTSVDVPEIKRQIKTTRKEMRKECKNSKHIDKDTNKQTCRRTYLDKIFSLKDQIFNQLPKAEQDKLKAAKKDPATRYLVIILREQIKTERAEMKKNCAKNDNACKEQYTKKIKGFKTMISLRLPKGKSGRAGRKTRRTVYNKAINELKCEWLESRVQRVKRKVEELQRKQQLSKAQMDALEDVTIDEELRNHLAKMRGNKLAKFCSPDNKLKQEEVKK